jgi:hypothetical protein
VTIGKNSAIANFHTLQFTTARTKSFQSAVPSPVVAWWRISTMYSSFVLRILSAGDCATTGSLFRLRLFWDRLLVGQSVLVSGPRFVLLSDICGLHVVGRPPWREDGSVIYSYNLLSLSGPRPSELMTTSYCPIWDSPNPEGQVPVLYSPGTEWPSYSPGHWVPFLSPLTTRRWRWRHSIPPPTSSLIKIKIKMKLYCDRRSVGQFVLVSGPLWSRWPDFYISLSDNYFISSSLKRGRVCNLQCNYASWS